MSSESEAERLHLEGLDEATERERWEEHHAATADDLTRLRAVTAAATPGPWEADGFYVRVGHEFAIALANSRPDTSPHDAEFIATFDPPTVAALIDRVERAERERDEARRDFARAHDDRMKWQTEWYRLLDSSCLQGVVGHRLCDCIAPSEAALRAAVAGLADATGSAFPYVQVRELRALLTEGADDGQ